jgi:hypothetical protein
VIDLGSPFQAQGGTANFNCRTVTLTSMQVGTSGDPPAAGKVIADGLINVLQGFNFYAGSLQGMRSLLPAYLSLPTSHTHRHRQ